MKQIQARLFFIHAGLRARPFRISVEEIQHHITKAMGEKP
jgi:hypothetical protein